MMERLKQIAKKKTIIGACSLVAVTGTYMVARLQKAPEPPQYVMAAVTRGTLMTSVNGSGQVSGQDQMDVKPAVSGMIMHVMVQPGDVVKAGTPLVEIDRKVALKSVRDASQNVRDAALSLQSAQLSLQKLKQPADPVSLVQAQNTLNQAKRDLTALEAGPDALDLAQAEADLQAQIENTKLSSDGKTPVIVRNAYDDAVPTLKTVSQTLQQALADADSVLGVDNTSANDSYERLLSVADSSKLANALATYPLAKQEVLDLKSTSDALIAMGEDTSTIDTALTQAQQAVDNTETLTQQVEDVLKNTIASASFSQSSLDSLRSMIQSDHSNVSSKLATLTSQIQSLAQAKSSFANAVLNLQKAQNALDKLKRGADPKDIASAEERVTEAEASLNKLQHGADPIDVSMSENSVEQRRSALQSAQNKMADAQETLNDYTVRAPFDGVVARLSAQAFDQASPGTALATLLTQTKIAQISLNEVDAAKVKAGEKSTLSFDAIPNLSIAGAVEEIDPLGTVSQGVVNYAVKIAFATQDDRIKPGMSVSASVITEIHPDVLMVPNAAVHASGNGSSVQTFSSTSHVSSTGQTITSATPPDAIPVEVGLSNDSMTEITNGVQEGDRIVVRTIDPAALAAAASRASSNQAAAGGLRIPGLTGGAGGGGGTFRAGGGGGAGR